MNRKLSNMRDCSFDSSDIQGEEIVNLGIISWSHVTLTNVCWFLSLKNIHSDQWEMYLTVILIYSSLKMSNLFSRACWLLGASTRDPTHDKVVRRRPDKQGRSGLQGFWKAAPALTLKMISVFLMLAILDYALISETQVDSLPQSLSKQNQLRTLINMSPRQWYPIRLSRM